MDQRKHKHSDQQVFWWRTRGSSPTEGGRRQRPGWQRRTGLQGCLNPEGNLAHSQGLWWAKRVKESKGEWPCPEERGLMRAAAPRKTRRLSPAVRGLRTGPSSAQMGWGHGNGPRGQLARLLIWKMKLVMQVFLVWQRRQWAADTGPMPVRGSVCTSGS